MLVKKILATLVLASVAVAAEIPRKAPDFPIALPDGKKLNVAEFHGNVLALLFILTTCQHCQKTTGVMTNIQNDLRSRGLRVVEAAINENPNVPNFVEQFKPSFPVGEADYMKARAFMGIDPSTHVFVPMMVLIDRAGTIRVQHMGTDTEFFAPDDLAAQEKNIRAAIEPLLSEHKKR